MAEFKMPKSKRGANRQANAIVNKIYRAMSGGTSFGVDWRTARSAFPNECAHFDAIKAIYNQLPE